MNDNFIYKYPIICLSSFNSELFTYPVDSTRVRMQISSKSNLKEEFIKNFKNKTLYDGFKFALVRQLIYNGSRMFLYEKINKSNKDIKSKAISAIIAGGLGQAIASPFDLLKIRKVNNNNSGIKNVFSGVLPNILRASTNSLGYLASYDITKKKLIEIRGKEDIITYSSSSLVSGLSSTILCTPFDNLKSKMMGEDKYKSMYDCFRKTIKKNGYKSMYVGFLPNWARSGPWHFIFWNSYEFYSKLFNLQSI